MSLEQVQQMYDEQGSGEKNRPLDLMRLTGGVGNGGGHYSTENVGGGEIRTGVPLPELNLYSDLQTLEKDVQNLSNVVQFFTDYIQRSESSSTTQPNIEISSTAAAAVAGEASSTAQPNIENSSTSAAAVASEASSTTQPSVSVDSPSPTAAVQASSTPQQSFSADSPTAPGDGANTLSITQAATSADSSPLNAPPVSTTDASALAAVAPGSQTAGSSDSAVVASTTNSGGGAGASGISTDSGAALAVAPADGAITADTLQPLGQGVINGVLFGVDGHPEWGGSYSNLTPQQQADAVKSMGLGIYQGDINDGSTAQTQALLTATQNDGLQFLANIGAGPGAYSDPTTAYNDSFQEGATEGADFGSQIKLFQLGNEADGYAMQSPQNFQIEEAEIQGLTAGLKSTDPSAETIVNTTNQPTGIQFLQQLQADGVNWDISGFHTYTQNGDIADNSGNGTTLAAVAALGKPIYITEFNGWGDGTTGPSAIAGNAQLMTNSMSSIESVAQQYDIIGANAYELLDQPENGNSAESQFGVLTNTGGPTATSAAITSWMNSSGQSS